MNQLLLTSLWHCLALSPFHRWKKLATDVTQEFCARLTDSVFYIICNRLPGTRPFLAGSISICCQPILGRILVASSCHLSRCHAFCIFLLCPLSLCIDSSSLTMHISVLFNYIKCYSLKVTGRIKWIFPWIPLQLLNLFLISPPLWSW